MTTTSAPKPGAGLKIPFRTRQQNSEAGQIGGTVTELLRVGIHALSREEKAAAGRKGGIIGGAAARERKLGVHALTREQLRATAVKTAGVLGNKLWTPEESALVAKLRQDDKYQHGASAVHRGKPNWALIALELNIEFHGCSEVRSAHATEVKYSKTVRMPAVEKTPTIPMGQSP